MKTGSTYKEVGEELKVYLDGKPVGKIIHKKNKFQYVVKIGKSNLGGEEYPTLLECKKSLGGE